MGQDIGIDLHDVSVEFKVYNGRSRSLRRDLLRRVGGGLSVDDGDVVRIQALKNITISLRPGDRLGLVGHNGSGKSTLLRVLAGAYEPSSGTASIRGRVAALTDIGVGMEPELTGRQNIRLRGAVMGMSPAEIRKHTDEIIDFSDLGNFIDLPVRTYSSGMALRLAFAISTATQPDILILDELITVGDAAFSEKAQARITKLMDGAAILAMATHDEALLQRYCNKITDLSGGHAGSPRAL